MILDKQLEFSDAQAITATAASTNLVDFGHAKDVSFGEPLEMLIKVIEVFDNLTSLKVDVEVDDNASFSSATVIGSSTQLLAALTAGAEFPINFVPTGTERYMRLNYTVVGTTPTTGTVNAHIIADRQSNK